MAWIPLAIGAAASLLPKTPVTTDTTGHTESNTWQDSSQLAGSVVAGETNQQQTNLSSAQQIAKTQQEQQQQQQQQTSSQQIVGSSTQQKVESQKGASDSALNAIANSFSMAQSNASDPTKTNSLVSDILTKAAMAFAPNQAVQTGAGLYNSTTNKLLSDFAQGSATAQAASGVLGYQTEQQKIATANAANLAAATETNVTTGNTNAQQVTSFINQILTNLTGSTATNNSSA